MAGAYPTERISPSPLLSYSDDSPSYRQNVGLKLCVSVSPTGQRGSSRVGASCLVRTSRKRQLEKCNARTCRWQVNDVYGTFFPMKLTCADAQKSKQTHVANDVVKRADDVNDTLLEKFSHRYTKKARHHSMLCDFVLDISTKVHRKARYHDALKLQ